MKKPQILYVIHGWTYTVAPWEKTITLLAKQGIKVEMLHVPGLTSPSKKVWTIDEYVKWADRNIPDGAVALGHSNGGRILLNLCSEKPDKLQHLILLDAAGVYENSGKRDIARSLSKKLGFLKRIPGLTKIWHKLTGATDYDRAPANMKQTLANMLDSDKKLDLTKVTVPTSIIWGAADTVTPPRQAEVMHEKIHGSTLEIFPGWNHAPYLTHPAELAKAILHAYKKPPVISAPSDEITHAAAISASMAMKKAAEPIVPSTADISASMAMKKASGPNAVNTAKISAALAAPGGKNAKQANAEGIISGLKGVEYEKANLELPGQRQIISTSSVPKVSRIEKLKRAAKRKRNAKKINKAKQKTSEVNTSRQPATPDSRLASTASASPKSPIANSKVVAPSRKSKARK